MSGYRLERTLSLPRNIAFDHAARDDFMDEQLELARSYSDHCTDAQKAAISDDQDFANNTLGAFDQSVVASKQAGYFVASIRKRKRNKVAELAALLRRSNSEPTTGRCDAILVVSCPGVSAEIENLSGNKGDSKQFLKASVLIHHLDPEGKDPSPSPRNLAEVNSRPSNVDSKAFTRKTTVTSASQYLSPPVVTQSDSKETKLSTEDKTLLHNIFAVNSNGVGFQPNESLGNKDRPTREVDPDLLLSVLDAEYKKTCEKTVAKAMNQARTYCTASLYSLAFVGIKDYPVFSLVTSGTKGAVYISWFSSRANVRFWFSN